MGHNKFIGVEVTIKIKIPNLVSGSHLIKRYNGSLEDCVKNLIRGGGLSFSRDFWEITDLKKLEKEDSHGET